MGVCYIAGDDPRLGEMDLEVKSITFILSFDWGDASDYGEALELNYSQARHLGEVGAYVMECWRLSYPDHWREWAREQAGGFGAIEVSDGSPERSALPSPAPAA